MRPVPEAVQKRAAKRPAVFGQKDIVGSVTDNHGIRPFRPVPIKEREEDSLIGLPDGETVRSYNLLKATGNPQGIGNLERIIVQFIRYNHFLRFPEIVQGIVHPRIKARRIEKMVCIMSVEYSHRLFKPVPAFIAQRPFNQLHYPVADEADDRIRIEKR